MPGQLSGFGGGITFTKQRSLMCLDSQPELTPLTAKNVDGIPYSRPAEVELEIIELGALEREALMRRITSGTCCPEAMVYFFRFFGADGEMRDAIFEQLARRVYALLRRRAAGFAEPEDFIQEVFLLIIRKISDYETSAGDFAQVRFGDFVVSESGNVSKRVWTRTRRDEITDSIDDIDDDRRAVMEIPTRESSVEDRLIARSELARLPAKLRLVSSLYFVDGWKIASKDPGEMTLSRYFNISDRQIRNWLREAQRVLADARGGHE